MAAPTDTDMHVSQWCCTCMYHAKMAAPTATDVTPLWCAFIMSKWQQRQPMAWHVSLWCFVSLRDRTQEHFSKVPKSLLLRYWKFTPQISFTVFPSNCLIDLFNLSGQWIVYNLNEKTITLVQCFLVVSVKCANLLYLKGLCL